jgi:hypothetical protein
MDASLVPLFEKLRVKHASTQRFAVRAIFLQLRKRPDSTQAVLQKLLTDSSETVVVDETTERIVECVADGTEGFLVLLSQTGYVSLYTYGCPSDNTNS